MTSRGDPALLVDGVLRGDRSALARLISVVESGGGSARAAAALLHPHTGKAYTVGITGAPGAGKSTLTDGLITRLRRDGCEVGVLAIDPTSPFTGGAILGDRVRMGGHATDPGVFIRSMATRGHLGGLAAAAREAVRVLDAAGKPWVLLETVGVGQVEVDVAGAADTTVVVVNPGWGDAVQAAKAGLLEIADVFAVNKADRAGAAEAARDLESVLDMAPTDWRPPVIRTVATTNAGVDALWDAVTGHRRHLESTGRLASRRRERVAAEVRAAVLERLAEEAAPLTSGAAFDSLVERVVARDLDPYQAAEGLLPG